MRLVQFFSRARVIRLGFLVLWLFPLHAVIRFDSRARVNFLSRARDPASFPCARSETVLPRAVVKWTSSERGLHFFARVRANTGNGFDAHADSHACTQASVPK
uniref:Uncharacterized protein n=1 Tax=Chrysotila carterae TaxID=13221 RepID=A0A7S4B3Y4_CHRCT|eukprot:1383945-Pleurochrysis_carterae.AAC.1